MARIKVYPLSAPFEPILVNVLKHEGGYQCSKNDSGNFFKGKLTCTNKGITGNAFYNHYKKEPTPEIIKSLTVSQVKPIYKTKYWDKIRGDEIENISVADLMMFVVVNSGTGQISELKRLANKTAGKKILAETDTSFTSNEIKLLNQLPQDIYFNNIKTAREKFYRDLVAKKPQNSVFLKGWLSRLDKHQYSGAKSRNNTPLLLFFGVLLFAGGAVAGYKYS